MMNQNTSKKSFGDSGFNEDLFSLIAKDLTEKGYSIRPAALDVSLTDALLDHLSKMNASGFSPAGVGREAHHVINDFVRTDEICWITGESSSGKQWLHWASDLQSFLNRRLFLGLFSFESHFSHYQPGDFYKRHLDAFKGEANRILSLVVYLNPEWTMEDGGELVLYQNMKDREGIKVIPLLGTVVVFLSEEFPHEVIKAKRERYSIAGWFRINTSVSSRVDPPV